MAESKYEESKETKLIDRADLTELLLERSEVALVVRPPEDPLHRILGNSCWAPTYRSALFGISILTIIIRAIFTDHAQPPNPTSTAGKYPKLYACLGAVSILCRLGAMTLPISSSSAEILRVVQENKLTFNKSYKDNLPEWQPVAPSPDARQLNDVALMATEISQGVIQLTAFPTTFIGAQKIASAENMKEVLTGVVFLGTGITGMMLNSAHNFASPLAREQGKDYAGLCYNQQGCLGEKKQYLPTFPTGINGFVSSIAAVVCGFMHGITERARAYMRETNPPDNRPPMNSVNS